MRSAIYFPEIEISSEATMCSALLMWDEIEVIVPWDGFKFHHKQPKIAKAWELIGGTICPDRVQQQRAHESIVGLIESGLPVDVFYRGDVPPEDAYEMWPQKLLPETWDFLRIRRLTSSPLANGDYPFEEQGGLAVMAKLADACGGTTFARWTDRFLAYGLVADRDAATAVQTAVVPLTRQFESDMRRDLRDLREALGFNIVDAITSPVIVTSVVAASSWLATAGPVTMTTIMTVVAAGGASKAVEKAVELFRSGRGFSAKQRKTMSEHPMAYLYQLSRAR